MKNMNISPQTPIQDMTAGQLISCMAITVMTIVIGYAIAQLIIGLVKAFFRTIAGNDARRLAYAVVPLFVMLIVVIAVIATAKPMLESMGNIKDSAITKLMNTKGN